MASADPRPLIMKEPPVPENRDPYETGVLIKSGSLYLLGLSGPFKKGSLVIRVWGC